MSQSPRKPGKQRLQPTPRALWIAAAGVGPALLPALVWGGLWPLWLGFGVVLGVALALDVLNARPLSSLALRVSAPSASPVGTAAQITLSLAGGAPLAAELRLETSGPLPPPPPQDYQGPSPLVISLVPARRGVGALCSLWVRYAGPLGLMARVVEFPLGDTIEVLPNVAAAQHAALKFIGGGAGLTVERYAGDGSEFDSLREFVPGLDRRSIDWKSSARHGALLSRQNRAERDHQIVFAIDTGHLMGEAVPGGEASEEVALTRLDHAVHAALLAAVVGLRAGDRIGLYAFDAKPGRFLAPANGRSAFPVLSRTTAQLSYTTTETNFTLGLMALSERLHRRSLVVVLTDFVDTTTAALLVENLARLAKRHLVMFVALQDVTLRRASEALPVNEQDLQRAVVADELLRDRLAVLARLRALGIQCVDAPPGQAGIALVRRYLETKRRELV